MTSPAIGTQQPSAGAGRAGLAMAGAAPQPDGEAEQAAALIVQGYRQSFGISGDVEPGQVAIADLIPSQNTSPRKVAAMVTASAASFPAIWISRAQRGEHKVFDGHHRLAAAKMRGDVSITAVVGTIRDGAFYPDPPATEPTTEAEQEAARIVAAFQQNGRARR
jgi:hypothetical protein